MIKRQFMRVKRGPMDSTIVCVFPWEVPILEEIHGTNAVKVSIEELCSIEGSSSVSDIPLKTRIDKNGIEVQPVMGMSMRAQLEAMTKVSEAQNPLRDVGMEWGRCEQIYGNNPEQGIPYIQSVFMNIRVFRMSLRDYAAGKVPAMFADSEEDDNAIVEEKSIAEMSVVELKDRLTTKGIKFSNRMKRADLEELLMSEEQAA